MAYALNDQPIISAPLQALFRQFENITIEKDLIPNFIETKAIEIFTFLEDFTRKKKFCSRAKGKRFFTDQKSAAISR